jgi:hypothetical protein
LTTDLDGIADTRKQAILVERFLNEVERAELDGGYGHVDIARGL